MKIVRLSILAAFCLSLTSCATVNSKKDVQIETLDQLYQLRSAASLDSTGVGAIRAQALTDTAMSLAAQTALAQRSKQIDAVLEQNTQTLTQTFNFRGLLLKNNVLPPVLQESRNSLNLADADTIRLSDRTYRIYSQARFVTAPPDWRDYLWMAYTAPQRPSNSLLPKTSAEIKIWNQAVDKGWLEGMQQADAIYAENLARLKRDFNGMVLYRKLLAQNMVSAPFVAQTNMGVTGDGNELRINDQVLRITALPKLQGNSKAWKPAFNKQTDDDDNN